MISRAWVLEANTRLAQQDAFAIAAAGEIRRLQELVAELERRIEQLEQKRGPGRPPKQ